MLTMQRRRKRRSLCALVCRGRGRRIKTIELVAGENIQDAIDAITEASASYPYEVRVGPGTFDERVTLAAYVSIRGCGQDETTLKNTGVPPYPVLPGDQTIISDLSINQDGIATSHAVNALGVNGITFRVENCWLQGEADVVYISANDVTCYVAGCDVECPRDGIVASPTGGAGQNALIYVADTTVTIPGGTDIQGALRVDQTNQTMYAHNVVVSGTKIGTTGDMRIVSVKGTLELRNVHIDVQCDPGTSGDIYGVASLDASASVKVFGGSFTVRNPGAGDAYDLFADTDCEILIDGDVVYATSSGTITQM